jgi:2,4-dienoyl-CoA reductase-like NADH-dependent reductase (Old Yellow Enzyme family)
MTHGPGQPRVPRLFGDDALAAWRKVSDGVHAVGGLIFAQLWHIGSERDPDAGPFPDYPLISPSGINTSGRRVGEPATVAQLAETVEAFAGASGPRSCPSSTTLARAWPAACRSHR